MTPDTRSAGLARASHAADAVREGDRIFSRRQPIGSPEPVGAMLDRNAERWPDRAAFASRDDDRYRPVSWSAFRADAAAFGRFLEMAGVGPGSRVMLVSPNCPEVLIAEFATMALGAIWVPIFAGYPAAQTRELIRATDPAVLIVAGAAQLKKVVLPSGLRALVTIDAVPSATLAVTVADSRLLVERFNGAVARFAGNAAAQRAFFDRARHVDPHSPALIMFTSGTSGRMKGVVLTHDNILSQQRALAAIWNITPKDRFLSYLPWHHSFGGLFEKYTALTNGAVLHLDDSLGKDFTRLLQNWKTVQPTVYFSAPRIHQQLVAYARTHPEDTDRIFHSGLQFVFTAAAPLPANVSAFFAERGIPVVEGWGLTETSPCCTLTDFVEPRTVPGMVGYPIPGVTLRLAADGEILVQGPNVMLGYLDDPIATARALPGDGWFRTGDLGEFVGAGLRLVARKDRVFKLLNAEKVVPTEIENRLAGMNDFIRHVIVVGEGEGFLAALIFPDYFRITEQFGEDHAAAEDIVKASYRETILKFNEEHPVKYERLEAFAVVARELTIEDRELTPSLKVRVRDVLRNAEGYLEALYDPGVDCDCRFLRKVMRLKPDDRRCLKGLDRTFDRCHECGSLVFNESTAGDDAAE
jgi:long-subunit acyl-CoA synthetase (AMP-forming)